MVVIASAGQAPAAPTVKNNYIVTLETALAEQQNPYVLVPAGEDPAAATARNNKKTARDALITTLDITATAATTARDSLVSADMTAPATNVGPLDKPNLITLIEAIKTARSRQEILAAIATFKQHAGGTRLNTPPEVIAMLEAFLSSTQPTAETLDTQLKVNAPSTPPTFDEALKTALLPTLKAALPILAHCDAQDALAAEDKGRNDKVKEAAIDAFLSVKGIPATNINDMQAIYNGLEELRNLWKIAPDISKLNSTKPDCNVEQIFGEGADQRLVAGIDRKNNNNKPALGFFAPSTPPHARVYAYDNAVVLSGDMSHKEIMAVLQHTCEKWKKEGLKITVGKDEHALGVKIAAALDALSIQNGYEHYNNYQIIFEGDQRNWRGAFKNNTTFVGTGFVSAAKTIPLRDSKKHGTGYTKELADVTAAIPDVLNRRGFSVATVAPG